MASEPKELMWLCTSTLAMEITEFWMPEGMPLRIISFSMEPSKAIFRQSSRMALLFFISAAKHSTMLTPWAMAVAAAAAPTPQPSQATNTTSRITFSTEEKMR